MGRPTKYTEALGDELCRRLADGESLNSICNTEGMPAESTVRSWAIDPAHPVSAKYVRAREIGFLKMADELLDISDDGRNDWMKRTLKGGEEIEVVNKEVVDRSKLRVETRKWILSKMLPKVFGEKVTNEITGSLTMAQTVDKPPTETREEWIARRSRELGGGAAVGAAARPANGRHHS